MHENWACSPAQHATTHVDSPRGHTQEVEASVQDAGVSKGGRSWPEVTTKGLNVSAHLSLWPTRGRAGHHSWAPLCPVPRVKLPASQNCHP